MNLLKVLNSLSDVNARILKNIYTATIQSTLEYGAVTFGIMAASTIGQVTGRPESRNASYSGSTTRHKCQDDETQTSDVTRRT